MDLAATILQICRLAAGTPSREAPEAARTAWQTRGTRGPHGNTRGTRAIRAAWQSPGTRATRRRSLACHLEEERHGASQLQVGKCNLFRTICRASEAAACVAPAGAAAASEGAMASPAAVVDVVLVAAAATAAVVDRAVVAEAVAAAN